MFDSFFPVFCIKVLRLELVVIIDVRLILPSVLHQHEFQDTLPFDVILGLFILFHRLKTLNHNTPIVHTLQGVSVPGDDRLENHQ